VLAKLSDECKLITKGTTPTTIGYDFVQEGVNFIKIENIQMDGSIDKTGMVCINQECNNAMKRSQLQLGDILFSIAGAIGRSAKVTESVLPANINQALAIIRLREDSSLKRDYLYAVLQSNYIEGQYMNLKRGVAQLNLSLKDVGNFMIPIPSSEEQEEFVAFNKQAEYSKMELHSAITTLICLERSILAENFN
jgi:type I restriction enzyme S subunit